MRGWFYCLLLCSLAVAQEQVSAPASGPDFSRAARERGTFYLDGIGHQYLQGKKYTVVAAAVPTLSGKYFGVKLHVFNRGANSVDVLPESVTADDSVGGRQLQRFTASEVSDRMQHQPAWMRVAGAAAGGAPSPMPGKEAGVPTMTDLLRELARDSTDNRMMSYTEPPYPTLTVRGASGVKAPSSAMCDLGCEMRNREIGDGTGPQLRLRSARPEQLEQSEFLANTIPPEGDMEGVLYFAMPKLTDRAPISHNHHKSYLVTVTLSLGDEKFQFVFPPE